MNQRYNNRWEMTGTGFLDSRKNSEVWIEGNLRKPVGWWQLGRVHPKVAKILVVSANILLPNITQAGKMPALRIYKNGMLRLGIALGMSGVVTLAGNCAWAQSNIVPDNTLGIGENSIVIPNFNGFPIEVITGGAQRGQNLFHSFLEFNVAANRGAYFFSPDAAIQNILARVTGGNPSEILGLLGTFGASEPNLFLINSKGIIFGENAFLDVGGSFVATTADSLVFYNGFEFSATNPQAPPLLTINVPIGLQYGSNPGGISNQAILQVQSERTLALVGGEVAVEGGILFAPDGRIELGSVAGNNRVNLTSTDTGYVLGYEGVEDFQDIRLSQAAFVRTSGEGGGSIQVQGREVTLSDQTLIFADTFGSENGGGILIKADQLTLEDASVLTADVFGLGQGGDVRIETEQFFVQDGSQIAARPFSEGSGGNVEITTAELLITDGARVSTSTLGEGEGGSLLVHASESVQLIGTSTDGQNSSGFFAQAFGSGKAGNLEIYTAELLITDGAQVSTSTFDEGEGGSLIVNASETVQVIGRSADGRVSSGLFARSEGSGKGGDLEIKTSQLLVADGGRISASTFGEGEGGHLIVDASESVQVIGRSADGRFGSGLFTQSQGSGKGGNLEITTAQLLVADGAQVNTITIGKGEAGSLIVDASESVQVIGTSSDGQISSTLSTQSHGSGRAGNLEITTAQLLVADGAQVDVDTFGEGEGGNLIIDASESVQVIGYSTDGQIGSGLSALSLGSGKAGNLMITTPQFLVTDGAQVGVNTFGEGEGGNLLIDASESVQVIGTSPDGQLSSGLFARTEGSGKAGNLNISTTELFVAHGARVSASTFGEGEGGNLLIDASESVQVIGTSADGRIGSGLFASAESMGNAGNLEIHTAELLVADGAQVGTGTLAEGEAGNLLVHASESVQVIGNSADGQIASGLFASSENTGKAGNLEIHTAELFVADGAQVSAGTLGAGEGGNLLVHASESVQVIGTSADAQNVSGLFASAESTGNAGNLEIHTAELLIADGAKVSASTLGAGEGGNLLVHASESVQVIGTSADAQNVSGLFASSEGSGNAGDLEITTTELLVTDGARVSAETLAQGEGGSLIIDASESVQVIGTSVDGQNASGLFASSSGSGKAGNLTIETGELLILDGAEVTVSSPQAQAGNLTITANSLLLNQGTISAETAKSGSDPEGGANITLNVSDLLLMRNESLISATALEQANGGNITINTPFLIALPPEGPEGSDITANASQGNGGRVKINAIGIFGIQFRDRLTPLNDITVTSEFGLAGVVDINTSFDVTQGLVTLPTDFVDATQLIDRRCTPNDPFRESSFYITGRGGIPQNPTEMLDADATVSEWVTLDEEPENSEDTDTNTNPSSTTPQRIIEAQGIVTTPDGQIYLAAEVPTVTPHGEWIPAVDCYTFRN